MAEWILAHRMALLVALTLLWSGLVRIAMGPIAASRMGLFGAPPVVLVTWAWLLDLPLLTLGQPQVVAWWSVAAGFAIGAVLDLRRVHPAWALMTAVFFAALVVVLQGAAGADPSLGTRSLELAFALAGALVLVLRNRPGARGASITRYVSHLLFAISAVYLMRLQGFAPTTVLAFGLMAVHLLVPMTLGALEAGWLQPQRQGDDVRRPSFPGWAGTLGLLLPLYLHVWLNTTTSAQLQPGELGLRAVVLLSLLLLADLVVRPARAFGLSDLRQGLALGTRTLYLVTAGGLVALAILAQRVQGVMTA